MTCLGAYDHKSVHRIKIAEPKSKKKKKKKKKKNQKKISCIKIYKVSALCMQKKKKKD